MKSYYNITIATIQGFTKKQLQQLCNTAIDTVVLNNFDYNDICGYVIDIKVVGNKLIASVNLNDFIVTNLNNYLSVGYVIHDTYVETKVLGITTIPLYNDLTKISEGLI